MFLIPEDGVLDVSSSQGSSGSAGSGDLDYTYEDLAASTGITRVFESFTCNGSVNLECYDCQNNTILISRSCATSFVVVISTCICIIIIVLL